MKKYLVIMLGLCLSFSLFACSAKEKQVDKSSESKKVLVAADYVDKLKTAGLSIDKIIVYTAETDTNKLLGRPNQYTSKVNFADTQIEQIDASSPTGGSVEVFTAKGDAENRKKYIDEIGKTTPMFAEYSYLNGKALLRINSELTPEQAEKYNTEFQKIN